jgi:hypothetical protein
MLAAMKLAHGSLHMEHVLPHTAPAPKHQGRAPHMHICTPRSSRSHASHVDVNTWHARARPELHNSTQYHSPAPHLQPRLLSRPLRRLLRHAPLRLSSLSGVHRLILSHAPRLCSCRQRGLLLGPAQAGQQGSRAQLLRSSWVDEGTFKPAAVVHACHATASAGTPSWCTLPGTTAGSTCTLPVAKGH